MRHLLLLSIVFLATLSLVFATEYDYAGDNQFSLDRGSFNQNRDPLSDISAVSKSLTSSKYIPLMDDLDGDGENEIIVYDSNTIKLYHDTSLTVVASLNTGISTAISNIIITDINGDGKKNIVFFDEVGAVLKIIQYNGGTSLVLNNSVGLGLTGSYSAGETMIQCRGPNDCLIVYGRRLLGITASGSAVGYAQGFNSTSVFTTDLPLQITTSTISQIACMPKIRHIEVADLTTDGDKEYIFSYIHYLGQGNDNDKYYVTAVDVTGTSISKAWEHSEDASGVADPGAGIQCEDNMGKYFTSPISFNIEPDTPLELETMYARNTDPDEYDIVDITASGSTLDSHPSGPDSGTGEIISNVFRTNAIPNSEEDDVCVTGYNDALQTITMICGSKSRTSGTFESFEFTSSVASITPNYNVTKTYLNHNVISHATQQSNAQTDGVDLSEVITPYGIYSIDFDTCSILANCDMTNIFLNFCGDAVSMAFDVEDIGSADLVCMTPTQLVYIDDLLSNQPATITQVTYDPCVIDTVVKVNETLKVTVKVTDGEQGSIPVDLVTSRVTSYSGSANEYVSTQANVTSGVGVTHFITLNATGNNQLLFIEGWDEGNPSIIDEVNQYYTVGENGITAGTGQSCTQTITTEEEVTPGLINDSLLSVKDDNVAISLLTFWDEITGLGAFLGWLFLMLVLGVMLFLGPHIMGFDTKGHFALHIALVFLFEAFLFVIGVGIGAIGVAGIVTIAVILVTSLAIYVSKLFQGSGA